MIQYKISHFKKFLSPNNMIANANPHMDLHMLESYYILKSFHM